MRTIRVDKLSFDVAEHKAIKEITLHMPSMGSISGNQTINHYTTDELILNSGMKFITFNTFQGETITINIDYIIMVEYGKLVDVDNELFFFVSENENYEVITKGNYGYTGPSFIKG
jgi:hypothetical protein